MFNFPIRNHSSPHSISADRRPENPETENFRRNWKNRKNWKNWKFLLHFRRISLKEMSRKKPKIFSFFSFFGFFSFSENFQFPDSRARSRLKMILESSNLWIPENLVTWLNMHVFLHSCKNASRMTPSLCGVRRAGQVYSRREGSKLKAQDDLWIFEFL